MSLSVSKIAARIFGAEFISDLEQRAGQTFAQTQPHEVGVAHQHRPPSPDGYIEDATQCLALYIEGGADEDFRLHDRDRAVGERIASKRPDRIGQQRRHAENFAGPDQTYQNPFLRDSGSKASRLR